MAAHALLYSAAISRGVSVASAKRRRILVGSVRVCLTSIGPCSTAFAVSSRRRPRLQRCTGLLRPSSGRVPTPVPGPVQLGLWVGGKRQRAGQKVNGKTSAGPRGSAPQGTNRMNSFPDRTSSPALPPAVRELAALCEYSEGSHEANARQRNSRRGVARRIG